MRAEIDHVVVWVDDPLQFGARGSAVESFFFPDPDQNIIEVRFYQAAP